MPFLAFAAAPDHDRHGAIHRQTTCSSFREACDTADHFAVEQTPPLTAYVDDVMSGDRWQRIEGLGWLRVTS